MEIFGHIVKSDEVIGIGPLFMQQSSDPAMRSLYNSFRYEFELHARTRSIKIVSDYFHPAGQDAEKEKANKWKEEYFTERKKIEAHIELAT